MTARLFPKQINPGDEVMVRASRDGGFFSDAGTVARGKHGRRWVRVTSTGEVREADIPVA